MASRQRKPNFHSYHMVKHPLKPKDIEDLKVELENLIKSFASE